MWNRPEDNGLQTTDWGGGRWMMEASRCTDAHNTTLGALSVMAATIPTMSAESATSLV